MLSIILLQHNVQRRSSPKSVFLPFREPAPFQIMTWKQHTKDAATSKTSEFLKAWSWASLLTSLSFGVECCSNKKHFNCDWLAPPTLFQVFLFFLQKERTWRFSLYLFYVRVNPLYTLRRNPAESVTVDFFIADPIKSEQVSISTRVACFSD